MQQLIAGAVALWITLGGAFTLARAQDNSTAGQVYFRFEGSPVYKAGTTVPLASVLLKQRITRYDDGSGSLVAVLLLSNRAGFNCEADHDMPLTSNSEFIVGISLYEPFAADEGPEKTVLHQMVFDAPQETGASQPVALQWKGGTAVLFRFGAGATEWHAMKSGREENGLTITYKKGQVSLALDYSDSAVQIKGRVHPTQCP